MPSGLEASWPGGPRCRTIGIQSQWGPAWFPSASDPSGDPLGSHRYPIPVGTRLVPEVSDPNGVPKLTKPYQWTTEALRKFLNKIAIHLETDEGSDELQILKSDGTWEDTLIPPEKDSVIHSVSRWGLDKTHSGYWPCLGRPSGPVFRCVRDKHTSCLLGQT